MTDVHELLELERAKTRRLCERIATMSMAANEAISQAMQQAAEKAWDEGARRCDQAWHDDDAISVFDRNPYRKQVGDGR